MYIISEQFTRVLEGGPGSGIEGHTTAKRGGPTTFEGKKPKWLKVNTGKHPQTGKDGKPIDVLSDSDSPEDINAALLQHSRMAGYHLTNVKLENPELQHIKVELDPTRDAAAWPEDVKSYMESIPPFMSLKLAVDRAQPGMKRKLLKMFTKTEIDNKSIGEAYQYR